MSSQWILSGPYANSFKTLSVQAARANLIYGVENTGVWFNFAEAVDLTVGSTGLPFESGVVQGAIEAGDCILFTSFVNNSGLNNGSKLNVYVVANLAAARAGQGQTLGITCGGTNVILLDVGAKPTTLAHELGHAMALWHANPQLSASFDDSNLMWPFTSDEPYKFITEGQTFRMHFRPASWLNVGGLRAGLNQDSCDYSAMIPFIVPFLGSDFEALTGTMPDCVPIERRIWPDGAFPSN
jgi:hypothetical protein